MITNNAAVCCSSSADLGLGVNAGLGLSGGGPAATTIKPTGAGVVSRVEQALQAALHGASSVSGGVSGSDSGPARGANVIAFPMVDPYLPIKQAGNPPVPGYNAFPRRQRRIVIRDSAEPSGRRVAHFNARGSESVGAPAKSVSESGFVDLMAQAPTGIAFSGFGDADDGSYSPLGMKWEGIIGQITTTTPAIISAFKGNPYYDPAQNFNPQLQPAISPAVRRSDEAPEGYYYDDRGTLRQIGSKVGGAVGSIGQSLSDFVQRNPLLVLGGGAAVVLLFMSPPRRR